jgi:hypothetical protein
MKYYLHEENKDPAYPVIYDHPPLMSSQAGSISP